MLLLPLYAFLSAGWASGVWLWEVGNARCGGRGVGWVSDFEGCMGVDGCGMQVVGEVCVWDVEGVSD